MRSSLPIRPTMLVLYERMALPRVSRHTTRRHLELLLDHNFKTLSLSVGIGRVPVKLHHCVYLIPMRLRLPIGAQ